MIARPVAVIPLACGRLELGLWPCGRLDTMVAGPVAVDMLPTTYDLLPTTDYRLPVRHYLGDVPCLAKNNEGSMLVERCMLTMRIERSICPLTRWMFATILVRRRLWSFLEKEK